MIPFSAGIIAAGEGSRLAHSHPGTIKPLVPVAGRPLSHWIVQSLVQAGAAQITLLTNGRGSAVAPSLTSAFSKYPFDFMTADTASSFESFRLVCRRLALKHEAFLVSTVDAIIPAHDIQRFWTECKDSKAEAGLALTRHVDDEKPLWADVDESGSVTAIGDLSKERRYVTCGLYYMTRSATDHLPAADAFSRLRDYWQGLISSKIPVHSSVLSTTLDVDRPEDIAAADSLLSNRHTTTVVPPI
jgi:NDP-sugar pyrophosphorylase family protein